MKKQSDLSRLMGYAGNYRRFTYVSWALSAVSALVPFVYIWKILRDVLNAAPDYAQAVNIPRYGWMEVSQINPEKLMILYSIVFQDVTLFDYWKTFVWGAKVPPTRKSLRRQSWQTVRNLPRSFQTSGTPPSARTAVPFPAVSASVFPSPALS